MIVTMFDICKIYPIWLPEIKEYTPLTQLIYTIESINAALEIYGVTAIKAIAEIAKTLRKRDLKL